MQPDSYHVLDYVDDYLHETVTPGYATYLEEHCERCQICKAALDEARKRFAALETVSACEASEQLIQTTVQRVERNEVQRQRRRRVAAWSFLSAAAASVLLLAGFNFYYWYMKPSPFDVLVYGQNQLFAAAYGSVRVRVMNQTTAQPVANVPVEIQLRGREPNQVAKLANFTTNAQGTGQPMMELPDWPDGQYQLCILARPDGGKEELTQTITLKRSWKLMLSTDKPVYKPGDKINVRSLALRKPNLKPVAGHEVTFSISDPKGNVIFKRKDVTSGHGIAATECDLATELNEGPYAIVCKVGDTESKLTVEVKKYVLPKFEIEVKGLEPYYGPGQRVAGTVHAQYFFGKPVADGEVKIKLVTTTVRKGTANELNLRTNAEGDAAFEFKLPDTLVGREQDSGDARFGVEVHLADTAGQKQSKLVTRVATNQPLRIEVIPESGTLVQGISNKIFLFASYPDGKPAKVRISVTGVEKELTTNNLGVTSFELTPATPQTTVTVRAGDDAGRVGRKTVVLTCGLPQQDFIVRTDKAVYDGGETVRLTALGGGVEPIFVDFIKDGQTILTESLDMTAGRGEYKFDLAPEVFGTVELCAYRFDKAGVPVRKTRVVYVRQARQLKIEASLDKKEYRPGKTAKLQFRLTDLEGKPAPGALSVAAVDKAVFSVLDQAPGMERAFYLLEQELLEPVYAIYPWSPDLTTSTAPEERIELEQALFSKTARSASGQPVRAEPPPRRMGRSALPPNDAPPSSLTASPHTLTAASFPNQAEEVRRTRDTGLERVKTGWVIFGAMLLLSAYGSLWLFLRPMTLLFLHAVGGSVGVFLLFAAFMATEPKSARIHRSAEAIFTLSDSAPDAAMKESLFSRDVRPKSAPEEPKSEPAGEDNSQPEPLRVREWFPETLLWQPQLITDKDGTYSLDIPLADSITDWRLTASAVTTDGRLGALQSSIRVFQPFFVDLNLPVALTRGDEVAIPVIVHNHLNERQTVELTLAESPWFELKDEAQKSLDVPAGKVLATYFRIRVTKVGKYPLEVTAKGSGVADALKKEVDVVPDGRRVEQVANGTLQRPADVTLNVPENAIEGSPVAILKIYPSNFSQLVEGIDNIFQMPSGCFEQTSSTTYPNILALDYLRRTDKKADKIEAKARQYIHIGYQRLLSFEVSGGGFDWFGRPPANRTLTAYGLQEFEDMAKVHDVDPQLIQRTRQWLLDKQQSDGTWLPEGHGLHDDPTRGRNNSPLSIYSTTAYIAWSVFKGQQSSQQSEATLKYLLRYKPEGIPDAYVLALTCNTLLALDPTGTAAAPYLDRLDALKKSSDDGKLAWWEQGPNERTSFYGSGRSGGIETTALAALAMLPTGKHPATVRATLTWLAQQKDASGTWHSTQATVLALKALIAGTGKALGEAKERRIELTVGAGKKQTIVIAADQDDVMKQVDLSKHLQPGDNRVTLNETSGTGAGYQLAYRYHVPDGVVNKTEPLTITIDYDKTELREGDVVMATAKVVNNMPTVAPMVILDLPIPAGFELAPDQLAELQGSKLIAKYQITARKAIVYLRGLEPNKPLTLRYDLRAKMPVKVTVPAAKVYEYYDPDKQGVGKAAQLTVTPRK